MSMGRRGERGNVGRDEACKVRLSVVRLNRGGYESADPFVYWGTGEPLYHWEAIPSVDDVVDADFGWLRASDRDDAKEQVRAMYPNARFYR